MKVIKEIQVIKRGDFAEIEVISSSQAHPDYTLVHNEDVENGQYKEDILEFIASEERDGDFTLLVEFNLHEIYSYFEKEIEVYSINLLESYFQERKRKSLRKSKIS